MAAGETASGRMREGQAKGDEDTGETVAMIVDSDPFARSGLRHALCEQNGPGTVRVLECDPGEDGDEAVAQVAKNSPDVVLIDVGYPHLDGLELARKVVRRLPGTRVVMLTCNPRDDEDELFEVIKAGAVAYVRSRQCEGAELVHIVKQASSGGHLLDEYVTSRPDIARRILRQFQHMVAGTTVEDTDVHLTPKEVQILALIAEGNSNKKIGAVLGVHEQTIKNNVSAILRKTKANHRAHAVNIAIRAGLLPGQARYKGGRQVTGHRERS